jgi:ATP/maltotriose-dependent transcriptional regulator MalT
VAWLSLDVSDNDPRTFFAELVAAVIGSGGVRVGSPLLNPGWVGPVDVADMDELWVQLADLPMPVVLVIDDFQEITDGIVLEMFGQLLALPPLPLHLVVLDRADPVLPLHQLRIEGRLAEIRAADLAFTPAEIRALFMLNNVRLHGGQADLLRDRTGGWPAGVRAAAMVIETAGVAAFLDRCRSDDLGVVDLFIGEVVRAIPVADLRFMISTSVPGLLTGDLVDQLTGGRDGQLVLERLTSGNIFTVDRGDGWFSYQPLLRELLGYLPAGMPQAATNDRPIPVGLRTVTPLPLPEVTATGTITRSDSERRAMESVITRLTTGFPTVPTASVRHIVNASWNEFPAAPIRDFVPVLVERNAREQLRHMAAEQSPPMMAPDVGAQ